MKSEYLAELRKLSITARSAVALLICEKYFKKYDIETILTNEFLEHLWLWPTVNDFESWEKNRPVLVNYDLGDPASRDLLKSIEAAGVDETIFRKLIGGATEVLWVSFWGAAEDELSFQALLDCIEASGERDLPVLTPFKFSTFATGDGWGEPISEEDRQFWRTHAKIV